MSIERERIDRRQQDTDAPSGDVRDSDCHDPFESSECHDPFETSACRESLETPVTTTAQARAVGASAARNLVVRHETRDPEALAEATGAAVRTDSWRGLADCRVFGTYRDGTITLYPQQIAERAESIGVQPGTFRRAVLAHELGHHRLEPVSFRPASGGLLERLSSALGGTSTGARSLEERAVAQFTTTLLAPALPNRVRTQVTRAIDDNITVE